MKLLNGSFYRLLLIVDKCTLFCMKRFSSSTLVLGDIASVNYTGRCKSRERAWLSMEMLTTCLWGLGFCNRVQPRMIKREIIGRLIVIKSTLLNRFVTSCDRILTGL